MSMDDVVALSDPLQCACSQRSLRRHSREPDRGLWRRIGEYNSGRHHGQLHVLVSNLDEFQLGDGLTAKRYWIRWHEWPFWAPAAPLTCSATQFPIGQSIKINGVSYEVVGVLEGAGGGPGGNTDENVFIPLTTAQSRLYTERTRSGEKAVSAITAQAAGTEQVEAAIEQITETLREQHGISLFGR